jgi:hypothetical protein
MNPAPLFSCLYCGLDKPATESSIEHAIPQFLGGDAAPKRFQLKNVCRQCNSRLGLWVDASFKKSWLVTNALASQARLLCTSVDDPGLPAIYIGRAEIPELHIAEGTTAEHWIGPSGETIVWVRPDDTRMTTYAGGNPIDAKRKASTVYFFPTRTDDVGLRLGLAALDRMFQKAKARKILGATCVDEDGRPTSLLPPGFVAPDAAEEAAVAAIRSAIETGELQARFGMNLLFDERFICKMALGVGYALFGDALLSRPEAQHLRAGVWPPFGQPKPPFRGKKTTASVDQSIGTLTHYPGAIVLIVAHSAGSWSLTLTLTPELSFTVEIAGGGLASNAIDEEVGYALVLVPYLDEAFETTLADLIAHNLGQATHAQLSMFDKRRSDAERFFKDTQDPRVAR